MLQALDPDASKQGDEGMEAKMDPNDTELMESAG
jgi:hypothetical protein